MNASAESTSVGWGEYLVWGLLALTLALAVGSYGWAGRLASQEQRLAQLADRQQILAQALARQALAAASGDAPAFNRLEATRDGLGGALAELGRMWSVAPEPGPQMAAVESAWRTTKGAVAIFLATRDAVLQLWRRVSEFEAFAADTLLKSDELVNVMVETGASPEQVYAATRQLMLLERLAHNLRRSLTGGADALEAAERFDRDVVHFRQVTQGLLAGDDRLGIEAVADSEARALLDDILAAVGGEQEEADAVLTQAGALVRTRQAADEVGLAADALEEALVALVQAYRSKAGKRVVVGWMGHGFAALAALLMVTLLLLTFRRRARIGQALEVAVQPSELTTREQALKDAERRSQAAILRLLAEVNAVADGDLGVAASVTEDATGAVAQAVNDMVAKFRDLVGLAHDTVVRVEAAIDAAGASAAMLAEVGGAQSLQPHRATPGGKGGAELEALTQQLLGQAEAGTALTAKVAEALDATRGSVREGAMALERATERCRAARDLAALVDDMADQANILALNTAIQASAVGGPGRGQSVVAVDVQKLAERLTQTGQRIEAQMRRTRAGIHEAINVAEEIGAGVEASARVAWEVREASAKTGEKLQTVQAVARQLVELNGPNEQVGVATAPVNGPGERLRSANRALSERLAELSDSAGALKQRLAAFRPSADELAASVRRGSEQSGKGRQELPATLGLQEEARTG